MSANKVKQELGQAANKEKAVILTRFFKTGPGQYGAGDKFLGVTVPVQRAVVKKFVNLPLPEIEKLLVSPYHEHRLTAVLILVEQYAKAGDKERAAIVKFYLAHAKSVNNWDLVDLSAPKIVGEWLVERPDEKLLARLVAAENLWERRIAVLATFAFIKRGKFTPTLSLAKKLLADQHDLMHKAVGWMLREVGKRDVKVLRDFLDHYAKRMPRTMLRYAIEKFGPEERAKYLKAA